MRSYCKRDDTHDDVIKWNQFPRYWPFMRGSHRAPVGFPSQRPVTRSFDVFFDLCLNKRLSKQWPRRCFETPLWRHCVPTIAWEVSFNYFSVKMIPHAVNVYYSYTVLIKSMSNESVATFHIPANRQTSNIRDTNSPKLKCISSRLLVVFVKM